jgi:hypothetical protein
MVIDGVAEQEARIDKFQELQHVLPILGHPLQRSGVMSGVLLRLYDGHEAGLFSSSSAAGVGSGLIFLVDVLGDHVVAGMG